MHSEAFDVIPYEVSLIHISCYRLAGPVEGNNLDIEKQSAGDAFISLYH